MNGSTSKYVRGVHAGGVTLSWPACLALAAGSAAVLHVLAKDGKSFLVQCKQWRTHRVGVSTIRELNGVISACHAAGGFVVTSGQFTVEAWQFAQSRQIELIDGERLASLFRELEPKPPDRPISLPEKQPPPLATST